MTPVIDSPVVDTGAAARQLLLIQRMRDALEYLRCEAVLEELQVLGSKNQRLLAWFEGRRNVLGQELLIPG